MSTTDAENGFFSTNNTVIHFCIPHRLPLPPLKPHILAMVASLYTWRDVPCTVLYAYLHSLGPHAVGVGRAAEEYEKVLWSSRGLLGHKQEKKLDR